MKFGDQAKLTDELWNELKTIIKTNYIVGRFPTEKFNLIENKFLCVQNTIICGSNYYWIASATEKLTEVCGGCTTEGWNSNFEFWSFWGNHKYISGSDGLEETTLDVYHGGKKAGWPDNWKTIVPNQTIIFRIQDNVLPYEDIKPKPVQAGASCLICKDYNPWMEPNSFCYICRTDPRNQYKIEEIKESLVKMASI